MNSDPYQVLGISRNATDEEVKKAYHELSRKYHPDSYVNNPLSDLAEEKFQSVQSAYEQIMNERSSGGSSFSGFGGSHNWSSASYGDSSIEDDRYMDSAYTYINARQYYQAINVLNNINNRNARWYYYYGIASAGIGNNIDAINCAQTAVNMEPGNQEYLGFLNQLNGSMGRYQTTRYTRGGSPSIGTGNLCCDLFCADTLCECMGGDLCKCI